ncbi:uncharacterized protein MYCFIDRAFT_174272 [Pseudocercospora fijiensis CIRAD86]|uniref:Uncharacterized protein n=1 Tax=Pseudocercospora fijiensis (strain CIRAD86) TaxID=383855 RepID=M3AZX6_PSEFD|nr:uncharacterized protein MYCFIDRAFT_174272 [Pseudocercospora fijiensis CIRAD86]EME82713.1 hypothetical protein MYCFIDRAFT_174272 [Pseudocercospora fijiensis CIRAD86]
MANIANFTHSIIIIVVTCDYIDVDIPVSVNAAIFSPSLPTVPILSIVGLLSDSGAVSYFITISCVLARRLHGRPLLLGRWSLGLLYTNSSMTGESIQGRSSTFIAISLIRSYGVQGEVETHSYSFIRQLEHFPSFTILQSIHIPATLTSVIETTIKMATTTPPFILTRATPQDIPEICSLMYDSFPPHIRLLFMGCESLDDLPKYQEQCIHRMHTDKSDIWIQVRDRATGKVIAAANWKVYVNGEPEDLGEEIPDWVSEGQKWRSEEAKRIMGERRKTANPGPFVRRFFSSTIQKISLFTFDILLIHITFRSSYLFHQFGVPKARRRLDAITMGPVNR